MRVAPRWIPVEESLPADDERVLCWLPSNNVRLPGGQGQEERNVVMLRFAEDWFLRNPSRSGRATHRHFWLGEGGSNCFFEQVTHWMPLPGSPATEQVERP